MMDNEVIPRRKNNNNKTNIKYMSRPKNPDKRYVLVCKVTGKVVNTNPPQYDALLNRYGITREEMDSSYVSREGRNIVMNEGLTPQTMSEKYGIHINVANTLRYAPKRVPTPRNPLTAAITEVLDSAPITMESTDSVDDSASENVEQFSPDSLATCA